MRGKFLFILLLNISLALAKIVTIEHSEETQIVEVSKTDINRIVCPVEITSVIYSKEKDIEIKREGRNLFVKFLVRQIIDPNTGQVKNTILDIPRDLYVECGGKIFSLILIPKEVPPTTIILKADFSDLKKAYEFEKSFTEYEKMLVELIKKAYFETPPDGYKVKVKNTLVEEFKELSLILSKVYEGATVSIEEYLIIAREDVELFEEMFIPYLKHPLAITIVKPKLKAGEQTRMIVVRKRL